MEGKPESVVHSNNKVPQNATSHGVTASPPRVNATANAVIDTSSIESEQLPYSPFSIRTRAMIVAIIALAGVVVVQFFFGFGVSYTYHSIGSYLIDVFPTRSARITGVQNLWRNILDAVMVQVFPTMLDNIGWGWSYSVMFFLTLFTFAGMILVVFKGTVLRKRYGPSAKF